MQSSRSTHNHRVLDLNQFVVGGIGFVRLLQESVDTVDVQVQVQVVLPTYRYGRASVATYVCMM